MNNAYHTDDAETLLRLKRQEADALLDVIRSFNDPGITVEHIFKIAKNTLLAQLGVRKMKFLYQGHAGVQTGLSFALPDPGLEALAELPQQPGPLRITAESHPHLHAIGVEYVIGMYFQKRTGAWFLIADFADSEAETQNDLIFIESLGNILSAAIENRQLIRLMVEQESMRRELEVAEKIQRQLLVTDFEDVYGARIFAENVSHYKIGGDFYDVIPRGELGFFVCIADVAGKGIGAALLMANLQANLRALILSQNTLEDIIQKLHKILINITRGEQFVTLFLAHIKTETRTLDYVNAGHNWPVLIQGEQVQRLNTGTIPLGIMDLPAVQQGTVQYAPDDVLFLFTDGLVEQSDPEGNLLGDDPVVEELLRYVSHSPREIIARIDRLHKLHASGLPMEDDITMLAVRFS